MLQNYSKKMLSISKNDNKFYGNPISQFLTKYFGSCRSQKMLDNVRLSCKIYSKIEKMGLLTVD